MTKSEKQYFILLISIMPIIDTLNGMILRNVDGVINIGQVYRIIVFLTILNYIIKYEKKYITMLLVLVFFGFLLIQLCLPVSYTVDNIATTIKLFIPIFLISCLTSMKRKKQYSINELCAIFDKIAFIAPMTILVPFMLGIGYHTYEGKTGYLGFYYATNEVSFFMVGLIIYLVIRLDQKIQINYIVLILLNALCILMIGTKSGYASLFFLFTVFVVKTNFINKRHNNQIYRIATILVLIVVFICGINIFKDEFRSVYNRWIWGWKTNQGKNILNFLTSGRTLRIIPAWKKVVSDNYILFGWGASGCNYQINCEMDFFDLFYGVGLIGTICIVILYIIFLIRIKKTFWGWVIIGASFILSFFGGHVLFAGLSGMQLGLLISFSDYLENTKE